MGATNAVGPGAGNNYHVGDGVIVYPQRLAQERDGEEIVVAKLDLDPLRYVTLGSKSKQVFDKWRTATCAV